MNSRNQNSKSELNQRSYAPQKGALILTLAGVVLLVNGWFWSGVIFGVVAWSRWERKKTRRTGSASGALMQLGREMNVIVPPHSQVQELLRRVERRYEASLRQHSHLTESLEDLVRTMWSNLSLTEDPIEWKWILQEVLKEWPVKAETQIHELKNKLADAKLAAQQWTEANREAWRTQSN